MPHPTTVGARRSTNSHASAIIRFTVAVLISCLATLLPAIQPVHAVPTGAEWNRGPGLNGAQHFVGQHVKSDGTVAYCTDFEKLAPPYAGEYDDGHRGSFTRSDGTRLSERENAALSYLLNRWGNTRDGRTAASVQLAVWAMTSPGMQWNSAGMNRFLKTEALPAEVVKQAKSMAGTALAEAGPYTVKLEPGSPAQDGTMDVTVQVLNGSGKQTAGLAATASVKGPFKLLQAEKASWTSNGKPYTLSLTRTGLGKGSIEVSVPRTPAAGVAWRVPSRADVQRLLTAAVLEPRNAAAAVADLPEFQPTVETKTSAAKTEAGSAIHDVLSVKAGSTGLDAATVPWMSMPGGNTPVSVEVVSTLWGPLPALPMPADAVPAGTPKIGTVTTRVKGPGTYKTPELNVPTPGWYVWTESIDPASAQPAEAAPYVRPWQGKYGISAETTFVPWSIVTLTELSAHEALVGESVTDSVQVSGFGERPESAKEPVLLSMYGPLPERPAPASAIPDGAPLHSQVSIAAQNGAAESPPFPVFTAPGCYTVVASYPGDEYTAPHTSAFGEHSETVCVTEPPAAAPRSPKPEAAEPLPLPDQDPVAELPRPDSEPTGAPKAELAKTGVRSELATGAALILIGGGLGLILVTSAKRRRA